MQIFLVFLEVEEKILKNSPSQSGHNCPKASSLESPSLVSILLSTADNNIHFSSD